jgi:hypothetical protein
MASKNTTPATPSLEELQKLTYIEVVTQTSEAVLKAITESQEQFLGLAKQAAEAAPKVPDFAAAAAPAGAVDLPSPQELVEASFDFAGKLLANQKAFADKYLAISGS